ncbi:MAG: hypothetical protein ACRDX9_05130, partial [Acidimicrobiia bacterium]
MEDTSMCRRLPRNELVVAVAILSGFLAAGELAAQDPGKARPTPITIPTTEPILAPQPIAKPPVSERVAIDPRTLPPDLELALRPSSSRTAPSEFTVRNTGLGDADNASLLRVTVRLLPLDEQGRGALLASFGLFAALGASPEQIEESLDERFADLCPLPYSDFQAAIDPLESGESQSISQSGARVGGGVRGVYQAAVRTPVRVQENSYVRQVEIRLVCVYEVRVTVDA